MQLLQSVKKLQPRKLMLGASTMLALSVGLAVTPVSAAAHCAVTHPAVNVAEDGNTQPTPGGDAGTWYRSATLTVPHVVGSYTDTCNDINISSVQAVNGVQNTSMAVRFFPTSGSPYFGSVKTVHTGSTTLVVLASNVSDYTKFQLYANDQLSADTLTD